MLAGGDIVNQSMLLSLYGNLCQSANGTLCQVYQEPVLLRMA